MLGKLAKPIVVALLSLSLGLHWSVLQSAAWLGMIVTYTHESSFTVALQKTFDGNHPCHICNVVAEGKKSEKKPAATHANSKIDLLFVRVQPILYPPQVEVSIPHHVPVNGLLLESPPKPPPRLA